MSHARAASEHGAEEGQPGLRCAIYTRKSTEEGLEQPFNSLHAQREAGEAYVRSHRHLGWTVIAESYDDGGYTGGHLERPALQKLLRHLEAGQMDCVVVYKVDRLSRSLLDFARLMGIFERLEVSLVSVTQPINTTASLGRLTLNILLSFAQFERDMIAERTRDKMAAARRKGKWVGGIPVLGYDVASGGGRLVIQGEEAQRVRAIFALYLERRSVDQVLAAVRARGWTNKGWRTAARPAGKGRPFTLQSLQRLLSNPVYIGQVRSQGETYVGEQTGLVEEAVWRQAQHRLSEERAACAPGRRVRRGNSGPPAGAESPEHAAERVPRITRLMALALKFEQMIRQGIVSHYAVLAAVGQVSRSRVTQIMNLLHLAPDIQEQVLFWKEPTAAPCPVCERSLRRLSALLLWGEQRVQWEAVKRGIDRKGTRQARRDSMIHNSEEHRPSACAVDGQLTAIGGR